MALFIDRGQTTQNGDGLCGGRFEQVNWLEASGQGRVFFKVLFVLAPGGRGDSAQLAARQGRFKQVGGIATTGLTTGTDQGVGFIDEQHYRLAGGFDFVDHALQATLKLALDAGTGLQQAEIQAEQLDIAQCFGHCIVGNAQGQAFD